MEISKPRCFQIYSILCTPLPQDLAHVVAINVQGQGAYLTSDGEKGTYLGPAPASVSIASFRSVVLVLKFGVRGQDQLTRLIQTPSYSSPKIPCRCVVGVFGRGRKQGFVDNVEVCVAKRQWRI